MASRLLSVLGIMLAASGAALADIPAPIPLPDGNGLTALAGGLLALTLAAGGLVLGRTRVHRGRKAAVLAGLVAILSAVLYWSC